VIPLHLVVLAGSLMSGAPSTGPEEAKPSAAQEAQAPQPSPPQALPPKTVPAPQAPAARPPAPTSPDQTSRATAEIAIGDTRLAIEYGRPSLGGATVAGLLEDLGADRVWRAGMAEATTLDTRGDLMIGGVAVPAGRYTLYLHAPAEAPWSLLVNRDRGIELKRLDPRAAPAQAEALWPRPDYAAIKASEVARIPLTPREPGNPLDLFTISLHPAPYGADLWLAWGELRLSAPVTEATAP